MPLRSRQMRDRCAQSHPHKHWHFHRPDRWEVARLGLMGFCCVGCTFAAPISKVFVPVGRTRQPSHIGLFMRVAATQVRCRHTGSFKSGHSNEVALGL